MSLDKIWKKAWVASVSATLFFKLLEHYLRNAPAIAKGFPFFSDPIPIQLIYAFFISSFIFWILRKILQDKYYLDKAVMLTVILVPIIWYIQHDIYNFLYLGLTLWSRLFLLSMIESVVLGFPIGITFYYLIVEKDVSERFL